MNIGEWTSFCWWGPGACSPGNFDALKVLQMSFFLCSAPAPPTARSLKAQRVVRTLIVLHKSSVFMFMVYNVSKSWDATLRGRGPGNESMLGNHTIFRRGGPWGRIRKIWRSEQMFSLEILRVCTCHEASVCRVTELALWAVDRKMILNFEVLSSSSIKRKKPWPQFVWLGKVRYRTLVISNIGFSCWFLVCSRSFEKKTWLDLTSVNCSQQVSLLVMCWTREIDNVMFIVRTFGFGRSKLPLSQSEPIDLWTALRSHL